jgi:hypothetical protein
MKNQTSFLYYAIFAIALFAFGCGDDNGSTSTDLSSPALALNAINTGTGDLDIEMRDEMGAHFCYEETGCEMETGTTFHSIFEDQSREIHHSDPSRTAVGVIVEFEVVGGEGIIKVLTGVAEENGFFINFEAEDVIYTSQPFQEGDVVSFEVGETD